MPPIPDAFLSDEDLDLRNLTDAELLAQWDLWLEQAQSTNDLDRHSYSHGVFIREPRPDEQGEYGPGLPPRDLFS